MDRPGRQHDLAAHNCLEAAIYELDANSPFVFDKNPNDGLAGKKSDAARVEVRTEISVDGAALPLISDR